MKYQKSTTNLSSFNDKEIKSANKLVRDIYEKINATLEADLKHADVLTNPSDKIEAVKAINNIYLYALDDHRPWKNKDFLLLRFSIVSKIFPIHKKIAGFKL